MPQPRNPKPIRPRVKDARAFDAALRKAWLDPFISDMQRRLAQAQGVNQAYVAMNAGVAALQAQPVSGIPLHMVISALRGVEGYNRAKMIAAFRSALGVDIRLFLTDATVQAHMTQALANSVDLIKTIPAAPARKPAETDRGSVLGRTVQSAAAIPIVGAGIQIERVQPPAVDAGSNAETKRRPESVAAAAGRGNALHLAHEHG